MTTDLPSLVNLPVGLESADDNLVMAALRGVSRRWRCDWRAFNQAREKYSGWGGAWRRFSRCRGTSWCGQCLIIKATWQGRTISPCRQPWCRCAGLSCWWLPTHCRYWRDHDAELIWILRDQFYWSIREFRYQQKKYLPVSPTQ